MQRVLQRAQGHPARHALPGQAPPGSQACLLHARRDLRRDPRSSSAVIDLSALAWVRAERREPSPALRAGGARPRVPDARRRYGPVLLHVRKLPPGARTRRALERLGLRHPLAAPRSRAFGTRRRLPGFPRLNRIYYTKPSITEL